MEITRYYFALTNFCNRSCELCSCHSDPTKKTFLSYNQFISILQSEGEYEAQLEGGEPTIHPEFNKMVEYLVNDPLCKKIILCTNAVTIPIMKNNDIIDYNESYKLVEEWLMTFAKKPFILKPSINSHLINNSKIHMEKMNIIKKTFDSIIGKMKQGTQLVFNVRLIPKPMTKDGEQYIIDLLEKFELKDNSNIFEYQRYGKGEDEEGLKLPFIVQNPVKFYLISPDGKNFGTDLIARANYMKTMK